MGLLHKIGVFVLAVSLVTFIALFGQLPALRSTPIGWIQRALCIHLPRGLKKLDGQLTGGAITTRSQRLGHYLFYEKNPVILVLFLSLLTGCAILFLSNSLHRLPVSLAVPIPVILVVPYILTYLCVTQNAHYITPANHHIRLHDYPFDYVIYKPDNICRTCNLVKPARSKHCSLCGVCVAKSDHHCPWVNNCVGRSNYGYFMGLLLSLSFLEVYGAYLSYYILRPYINAALDKQNSGPYWTKLGNALVIAVETGGLSIAGVGLLAASTAALPFGLFGYHCYLIWAGMTTNESAKWTDWRFDIADGCVFKASREALKAHDRHRNYDENQMQQASSALNGLRESGEIHVPWPVSSDQMLVQTNDGNPPHMQETLWTRIWSLSEVDNIYDLGGWDNFMEILKGR
ncbi:Hypothetical protein R9X50_00118600 [Acrodontium crateriforme]|uniref:Palmitoyltransferase n=1 Tax=Acrodontium crateriforme TaxID=150365 RepID=A0AAQ3M4M4_9PEZI|nr:Hypothetical protein R9X50_00118600 [Acrodontium crateriforme]